MVLREALNNELEWTDIIHSAYAKCGTDICNVFYFVQWIYDLYFIGWYLQFTCLTLNKQKLTFKKTTMPVIFFFRVRKYQADF